MNTAPSPRATAPFHWLRGLVGPLVRKWPAAADREMEKDSPQAQAAKVALLQAESPTERVHAMYQAQSAGVPLHEIEEQLDWSDARTAAGRLR